MVQSRHDGSGVLRGYVHLAAEICNRGVAENDEAFLRSEWFQYLLHMVCLYNNNTGKDVPDVMLRPMKPNTEIWL